MGTFLAECIDHYFRQFKLLLDATREGSLFYTPNKYKVATG